MRTPASQIAQVGRNTQGVTLMRVQEGETLQAIERLDVSLEQNGDAPGEDAAVGVPAPGQAPEGPPAHGVED